MRSMVEWGDARTRAVARSRYRGFYVCTPSVPFGATSPGGGGSCRGYFPRAMSKL